VVGHFPVLAPGQVFEYQSDCDAGATGEMHGCLHVAIVPADTQSQKVGMHIPVALVDAENLFEAEVAPLR